MLFLLAHAGVDIGKVSFAALGTNLFDAVRLGQVDAAMVQEPALSLIVEAGGRELFNAMELDYAHRQLGGAYEFLGVSVRAEGHAARHAEMKKIEAALGTGLAEKRTTPPEH